MNAFLDRSSVPAMRRLARILGTFIAFIALFGLAESITEGRTIPEYLTGAGFLLVFVGCVVGWFKDLAASLFILGGILLMLVTALAPRVTCTGCRRRLWGCFSSPLASSTLPARNKSADARRKNEP